MATDTPKFKVGDKVKILPRRENYNDYRRAFIDTMNAHAGETYTIESVYKDDGSLSIIPKKPDDGWNYTLDKIGCVWTSTMLKLSEQCPYTKNTQNIEVGDTVRIKEWDPTLRYSVNVVNDMKAQAGQEFVVTKISNDWDTVSGNAPYNWEYPFNLVELISKGSKNSKSSSDLVHLGDEITFTIEDKTLKYRVTEWFLDGITCNNDAIFNALGLNKYKFCTNAYGYEAKYGGFPECNSDDYEALTRVVNALQEECRKYNEGLSKIKEGFKKRIDETFGIDSVSDELTTKVFAETKFNFTDYLKAVDKMLDKKQSSKDKSINKNKSTKLTPTDKEVVLRISKKKSYRIQIR